ncbi:MAG: cupin domain-containing protein [Dehalococcoidales bacterium]|nr:cupin domain-containing protein [Dehalococcoidales bacterium]
MLVLNTNSLDLPESKNDAMVDTGTVFRSVLADGKDTGGYSIAMLTYDPGTKLVWHVHDSEQIIYVTGGKGILATRSEEYVVTPGMIVVIPAGEVHYHAAAGDSSFTHIAFYTGKSEILPE